MEQQPTMHVWTDAWRNADAEAFKAVYAQKAVIFPPNKPIVEGNDAILEFMRGGLGKVDVIFLAADVVSSENLVVERGVFRDVERTTLKVMGEGYYSVVWILENAVWKIHCHMWSMPVKF